MTFATRYGPWAIVAGASDGLGAAFAAGIAERGVNVVLLSPRQSALDHVAAELSSQHSVEMMVSLTRNQIVELMKQASAAAMGRSG